MFEQSDIIEDSKFIFEPYDIEKPSDLMAFIERYRQLDAKYNPSWMERQVSFHDGNLHYISSSGDFDRLIKKLPHTPFSGIGLSDLESIVLSSFVMRTSGLYRLDSYKNDIPPIVLALCDILDSALNKLPMFTGESLTRTCVKEDRFDFHIGEIFIPNYALTTSADMTWECNDGVQYIITPFKEKTRARALYHKNDNREKQVTFLRLTPFVVKDIIFPNTNKVVINFEEILP